MAPGGSVVVVVPVPVPIPIVDAVVVRCLHIHLRRVAVSSPRRRVARNARTHDIGPSGQLVVATTVLRGRATRHGDEGVRERGVTIDDEDEDEDEGFT